MHYKNIPTHLLPCAHKTTLISLKLVHFPIHCLFMSWAPTSGAPYLKIICCTPINHKYRTHIYLSNLCRCGPVVANKLQQFICHRSMLLNLLIFYPLMNLYYPLLLGNPGILSSAAILNYPTIYLQIVSRGSDPEYHKSL